MRLLSLAKAIVEDEFPHLNTRKMKPQEIVWLGLVVCWVYDYEEAE